MYKLYFVEKWGQIYTYQGQDGGEEGTMLCAVSFRFVIHFMIDIILGGKLKSEYKARLSLSSALTQKKNVFLYLLLRVW
jgi:hypothetical protein